MTRFRPWQLVLLAVLLLCVPPLACSSAVVIQDVSQNYSGTCPGLMDIEPYPCTQLEYIERLTVSPFALAVHLLILFGWVIPFTVILGVGWWVWRMRQQQQREDEDQI